MKNALLAILTIGWITTTLADNKISDTTSVAIEKVDSVIIYPDDAVLKALDQALAKTFFETNPLITDTNELDQVGFCADSVPRYTDEYYAEKLKELDDQTPFQLTYNSHVKAYIHLYSIRRRELTSRILGLSHTYFPMFEEMLDKYDLPLEFKYLAVVESALRPTAKSRVGATGMWQFMYQTGKIYGLKTSSYADDRMDPYLSTEAACKYFTYLYGLYHNWELVMAAYNCGPGNVNKAIRRSGGKRDYWSLWPYLPRETRGYVPAFIAVNYVMNNASAHNIYPTSPKATFFEYDTVHVKEELYFSQLEGALNIDKEVLTFINPRYKHRYIPSSAKGNILYLPREKVGLFIKNEEAIYVYNEPSKEEQERIERERIELAKRTKIHTVKNGEYLGLIAQKYGVRVSQIKSWNNMKSTKLRIGQKLTIYTNNVQLASSGKKGGSATNQKYYTIKSGDTLWDIAHAQGVSVQKLQRLNSSLNFKKLKPGTKIVVSSGS